MAGRSKGPWFWRGAWYAKLKNRRYYLCPGPETPERLTAAKEEYDELVRRLKGRGADPRIEEINRVLAERPEWIEVVRAILGIREDGAVFGRSAKWLELFKGAIESLVSGVGEAARGSILLEVEHPNPAPIVSPLGGSGTSADDLKKSIRGYPAFDEEEKDIADRLAVTAAEVGLNREQINNAFMNFLINHTDLPCDQRNAIPTDPEKVRALGAYRNPALRPSETPPTPEGTTPPATAEPVSGATSPDTLSVVPTPAPASHRSEGEPAPGPVPPSSPQTKQSRKKLKKMADRMLTRAGVKIKRVEREDDTKDIDPDHLPPTLKYTDRNRRERKPLAE